MEKYNFEILELKKPFPQQNIVAVDQVYSEWRKVFNKVLEDKGGHLDPDDFFRQDMVFILKKNQQIMGMLYSTFFDTRLKHHRDQHYIAELPAENLQSLQHDGIYKLMSFEYLTIHPDCRKAQANVHWSEVLISLALMQSDISDINGVIATPRVDLKVNDTLMRLGSKTLHPGITKMNYICSLEYLPKLKTRKFINPQTEAKIHELWAERVHLNSVQPPISAAA